MRLVESSLELTDPLALCYLSLLPAPLSPLPPPLLSPPPPLLSSPCEQAEPASAPHCAHSRCSPPLSLPMKEETTGVCMHPPIKTRLVGTLAGRGAWPGEVRWAGATRRRPGRAGPPDLWQCRRTGALTPGWMQFGDQPALGRLGHMAAVLPLHL